MADKRNPDKPAPQNSAQDSEKNSDAARKAARLDAEKLAHDPSLRPKERHAQIDGSGARFESDG